MAQPPIHRTPQLRKGSSSEVDPGALHRRGGAARVHGADGRRRDSVVVMKGLIKAQAFRLIIAVMTLASSALVLEAGQRWR